MLVHLLDGLLVKGDGVVLAAFHALDGQPVVGNEPRHLGPAVSREGARPDARQYSSQVPLSFVMRGEPSLAVLNVPARLGVVAEPQTGEAVSGLADGARASRASTPGHGVGVALSHAESLRANVGTGERRKRSPW